MAKGFLTVSLSDAEPTWQGRRGGGPRRAEGSRGSSKEREQCRKGEQCRGRTKSIFRLRYKIDNYTCYIGNRVPSPKHETNQYYSRERAWGTGIHA
jgi:hypothetical protein